MFLTLSSTTGLPLAGLLAHLSLLLSMTAFEHALQLVFLQQLLSAHTLNAYMHTIYYLRANQLGTGDLRVNVCKIQKELYRLQWVSSELLYVHVTVSMCVF